jgi:two-component system chemotaxis response regulator CheY
MESSGTAIIGTAGNMAIPPRFPETGYMDGQTEGRKRTVAIIEDEKDIIDVYSTMCRTLGLEIAFIAYDGAEGLEAFKRSLCPDIILIDHRMPIMTGLEAMMSMLDIDPDARFIVLSADEDISKDALDSGARAFIKKPASLREISSTIKKVLCQR